MNIFERAKALSDADKEEWLRKQENILANKYRIEEKKAGDKKIIDALYEDIRGIFTQHGCHLKLGDKLPYDITFECPLTRGQFFLGEYGISIIWPFKGSMKRTWFSNNMCKWVRLSRITIESSHSDVAYVGCYESFSLSWEKSGHRPTIEQKYWNRDNNTLRNAFRNKESGGINGSHFPIYKGSRNGLDEHLAMVMAYLSR